MTSVKRQRVEIVKRAPTRVACYEHRGPRWQLNQSIRKFVEWRQQNQLPRQVSATFNVFYDSTDTRIDLCAATEKEIDANSFGVIAKTIPGGRCAVLRHIGSDNTLGQTVAYLCGEWLPQSGEQVGDFPLFCERVEFFPDVPEDEAVTDVYLPLR
jgi:AraC family transcriptional regulator